MILRSGLVLTTSALLVIALPATGNADPGGKGRGKPVAGARTLGDPLLPQIGNGGYDVKHYRIQLDYDPGNNSFTSAKTTIRARATQTLKEFSLDFQDLDVASVKVDGRDADFEQVDATPQLSANPAVTQPMKLVVDPHPSTRPKQGRDFTVVVRYSGTPEAITDADESIEGWIRACYPLAAPQTCDGAFVVNQPIGAQSWFPGNNYPNDKATFATHIRVPEGKTALGVGENIGNITHSDGTVTLYGHINSWLVSVGERVMAGDQIATVGNRGNSTGPHCHFEVMPDGKSLVSVGYDLTVRIWPLPDGTPDIITLPAPLNAVAVAPDGEIITVPKIAIVRARAELFAIEVALTKHNGNITCASKDLDTSRRAIRDKLKKANHYPWRPMWSNGQSAT